ncbi:c-type cytochrome [Phaeodactylibacter luteus]|nr:cytochrome c [Phaeodactylibacter luteus]
MKKTIVSLGIAAFIMACGGSSESASTTSGSSANAQAVAAADKPDGEKIYKQYCVTCHGLYGDMGASGAFNLQESKLKLEERVAVITNGRNAMTAFEALLDADEIKAVAKYTMKLKP